MLCMSCKCGFFFFFCLSEPEENYADLKKLLKLIDKLSLLWVVFKKLLNIKYIQSVTQNLIALWDLAPLSISDSSGIPTK